MHCWSEESEYLLSHACLIPAHLMSKPLLELVMEIHSIIKFVHTHLLPHLMPFNGTNPHSIVILDNCSIHHVPEVAKAVQDVGSLLIFPPPYSPDLNPIEELFSKVKKVMKSSQLELSQIDIESLLLASFATVTTECIVDFVTDIVYFRPRRNPRMLSFCSVYSSSHKIPSSYNFCKKRNCS